MHVGRRVIGVIVALVLALVGTLALVSYVRNAADRAKAGETEVQVLVASSAIAAGTPANMLNSMVEAQSVAQKNVPEGAIAKLDSLEGLVAAADIFPGEQLVAQRFVEPSGYASRGIGVEVPEDMVELTIQLNAERTVGGIVAPGQRVTIIVTFDVNDPGATMYLTPDNELVPLPDTGNQDSSLVPGMADTLLHHVLVTAVQESESNFATQQERSEARLTAPPGGALSVTFALRPFDAERLVFAREFGDIWLALERESVPSQRDPSKEFDNLFTDESVAG